MLELYSLVFQAGNPTSMLEWYSLVFQAGNPTSKLEESGTYNFQAGNFWMAPSWSIQRKIEITQPLPPLRLWVPLWVRVGSKESWDISARCCDSEDERSLKLKLFSAITENIYFKWCNRHYSVTAICQRPSWTPKTQPNAAVHGFPR